MFQSRPGGRWSQGRGREIRCREVKYGIPKSKVTEKNGSALSRLPHLSLQISPVSSKTPLVWTLLGKKVITSGKPLLISLPLCFRWPLTQIDRSLKWFGNGESIDSWRTFTSLINFSMIHHYKVCPMTSVTPPSGPNVSNFGSYLLLGWSKISRDENETDQMWHFWMGQPVTITTNPRNFQCVQTLRLFQQIGAIAKFHICSVSKQCFAPTASSCTRLCLVFSCRNMLYG